MLQRHHICVCICTYQRSESLKRLLSKLGEQETEGAFGYSIVIVDNDTSRTAWHTVDAFARRSTVVVDYYVEPEQSIALARNKAIEHAGGDFIALIDDDEFPENDWLLNLYRAIDRYGSDG